MYYFGKNSKRKLSECNEKLQRIAYVMILGYGFTVICGYRNKEDQNKAYEQGFSTKEYPNSKHNKKEKEKPKSDAFDIIPDDGGWNAGREQFILMIGMIKGIALNLGIPIRCGLDFNSNNDLQDDNFIDSAHVELI